MSQFLQHKTDPDFGPIMLETVSTTLHCAGLSRALRQAFAVPLMECDAGFDRLIQHLDAVGDCRGD